MLTRCRTLLAAVLITTLAACGGNSLAGSIDVVFDLEFDEVAIVKQNQALRVEYRRTVDGLQEVPCKLVIDIGPNDLGPGATIDRTWFNDRVTIERVTYPGQRFPAVRYRGGELRIDSYDRNVGGTVSGAFDAFLNDGRTLYGTFIGAVEDAEE